MIHRHALFATSAVICLAVATPVAAQVKSFDIPAQPANNGIAQLGRQADVQIGVARKDSHGKHTNAVRGQMTVEEALGQLLQGTGLQARATGAQTYTILPLALGASTPAMTPAPATNVTAAADQATAAPQGDGDIVVTATRRAQNIRNVPSSLTVISGKALEDQTAERLDDFLRAVPGVQFNDFGAGQTSTISIRGVSTGTSIGVTQQSVGIYVDEIPFSDVFSFLSTPDLTPFDLDRVEVLRGPQGALYGAGSMGGVLRYVTAKPQLGKVQAKFNGALSGTEHGGTNTLNQAMLNLPFGDNFAVRGVISYQGNAGYVDSPALHLKNTDTLKQFHARIAARWKPTDRLDIQASYIYQKATSGDYSSISDPTGKNLVDDGGTSGIRISYRLANLSVNDDLSFADFLGSFSYAGKRRDTDINIQMTPAQIQTKLAPYERYLTTNFTPKGQYVPGTLYASGITPVSTSFPTSDAYFAEGRLTSKSDRRLRWLVGFLYSDISNFNPQFTNAPGIFSALSSYVLPNGVNAAQSLGVTSDKLLDFYEKSHATEKAAYFNLEYDITDRLNITAGGRYFHSHVSTQLEYNGPILSDIKAGQSAFQPRATLSYKVTPDTLLYGVFAKGYRMGGVNDTIGLTLLPGQKLSDSPAPLTYKTDSLYNYEAGIKSQLWGGKLLFDLSAYYIDWSNIQLSAFFPSPVTPSGGVAAISNAGAATIRGAEAQLTVRPAPWIEFVSSVSYNDAKLKGPGPAVKSALTGQLVSAPAGTQLPGSRKWQTSNTLILRGNVDGVPLTVTATHQYASSTLTDIVYLVPLPSYNLVNLNIDAKLRNNMRVGLFARNLFDEHKRVLDLIFAPRTYVVLTPRTMGVSFSMDF